MTQLTAQLHQITTMLELQDAMNARVNSAWREQNNAWYRAIWVECAELLDHYGWKWWKKQTPDVKQVELELIDIWHFGLSILLQTGESTEVSTGRIQAALAIAKKPDDFRQAVEAFAGSTLQDQQFHIEKFAVLMLGIGMSFDDLYRGYIGKNVLNFFRQDHGYQDGSYRKIWSDGREDNEHLVDAVAVLDAASPHFKDDIYAALLALYRL